MTTKSIGKILHAKNAAITLLAGVGFVAVAVGFLCIQNHKAIQGGEIGGKSDRIVSSLNDLLAMPPESLKQVDIGRMNLLCAQGLAGAEDMDIERELGFLDEMAARAQSETQRHFYRFQQHPEEFEHSEGFFRMLMLAVVLAEDFRVQYAPGKKGSVTEAQSGDGFFCDARDVFLLGLTGQERMGTCSSLPVLQVAVGRRLGYPLKLVATRGHLFVRWEDGRERFNVEAAGNGVSRFEDDYYLHWPFEVSKEEVRTERYLKSMNAEEELAVFMSIRGLCLRDTGHYEEAAKSFGQAVRLAPGCQGYGIMRAEMERRSGATIARVKKVEASKE